MKRLFVFFFILLFICSCSNKDDIPEKVLSQKTMGQVLWDVLKADELVNYETTLDTSVNRYSRSVDLYKKVFLLHHTSHEEFSRSLKFYQAHPALLQPILDSLQSKSVKPDYPVTPSVK